MYSIATIMHTCFLNLEVHVRKAAPTGVNRMEENERISNYHFRHLDRELCSNYKVFVEMKLTTKITDRSLMRRKGVGNVTMLSVTVIKHWKTSFEERKCRCNA